MLRLCGLAGSDTVQAGHEDMKSHADLRPELGQSWVGSQSATQLNAAYKRVRYKMDPAYACWSRLDAKPLGTIMIY